MQQPSIVSWHIPLQPPQQPQPPQQNGRVTPPAMDPPSAPPQLMLERAMRKRKHYQYLQQGDPDFALLRLLDHSADGGV
jgi:hypothetical protein